MWTLFSAELIKSFLRNRWNFTRHRTIYGSGDRFLFNYIQSNDILEGFVFGRTQTWPWCDDAVAEGSSVKKVWPCKSMCNHTEHYQPWQGQTCWWPQRMWRIYYQLYQRYMIYQKWSTAIFGRYISLIVYLADNFVESKQCMILCCLIRNSCGLRQHQFVNINRALLAAR